MFHFLFISEILMNWYENIATARLWLSLRPRAYDRTTAMMIYSTTSLPLVWYCFYTMVQPQLLVADICNSCRYLQLCNFVQFSRWNVGKPGCWHWQMLAGFSFHSHSAWMSVCNNSYYIYYYYYYQHLWMEWFYCCMSQWCCNVLYQHSQNASRQIKLLGQN